LTPEKIFEARWALTLLEDSMAALRREYFARGKESVFDILKVFVGIGESTPEPSYEEAAKALDIGVGTVKTLIHRLRRHYLAVVREEVARTVSDPSEIEEEIRALCDAPDRRRRTAKAVKTDSGAPKEERAAEPGSMEQEARTCAVCGTKFFAKGDYGFCPVCILRGAASIEPEAVDLAAGSVQSFMETKPARSVFII
jgi:hypothetical protein